nr:reverse transcriptase domain-containing protein [Tanacetum cinerariifolium]
HTEGYEDAIFVPTITADNFELKHGLLTLVQNKQFFRHDKEDPHAHIRYFNKITSTVKFLNVLNTSIKLMLFPFSLEGAAQIWLEKEPPRSIFTWVDLVSKFNNQFFPSSKTTNLHNEITNFHQRFVESFSEAWDRFKDLLQACPHHGNFLDKMPCECLAINEIKSKVRYSRDKPIVAKVSTNASTSRVSHAVAELKDIVKALLLDKKGQNQSPAPVNAVEESCVTCGGAHTYRNCPATNGNNYLDNIQEFVSQASAVNYNQGNTSYRLSMMSNQIRPPGFPLVPNNQCSKEQSKSFHSKSKSGSKHAKSVNQSYRLITKFVNSNSAPTSSSSALPSNMIANPKSDWKAITTRSGVSYDGLEATKDIVNPTNNGNTKDIQPQAVQSESPVLTSKPVTSLIFESEIALVSASKPNSKASIPYPSRRNDERNREKANNQIEKFYQILKDMSFEISFVDALILMPKFASTLKALIENKEKLSEMALTLLNEHCSIVLLKKLPEKLGDPGKFLIPCDFPGMAECLALADLGASINLMPFSMWKRLSLPDLTPTCMTLELADPFDADPRVPLILRRSFLKTERALFDVFEGELTLRVGKEAITFNLDQTLRYSANYSDMTAKRIDVIDMACEEYSHEVLGFFDTILSGSPTPYYDPIVFATSPTLTPFGNSDFLLEEVDAFLAIEDEPTSSEFHQSNLDPKRDILLLQVFLNDEPSLPPPNQRNYLPEVRKELKICEAKSNKSSIDEPLVVELKALPPHLEYAFLEGDDKLPVIIAKDLSVEEKIALLTVLKSHNLAIAWKLSDINFCGYFEIPIDLKDQEKTTFTCPYEMFIYLRMPFGLCNALGMLQRSMMAIFHNMIEKTMEEGIVLGYKISKQGIEVDKAKVDVISRLPHPTTVKDWDMPFELMCDASDFAIGAVLGKRQDKHFRPIHYASKTMIEAESNYITTEKECAYLAKPLISLRLATLDQQEVTMDQITQPERAIGENRVSWSDKLDDALLAFCTAYKTPIRCTPYKLVYGKACHLPVELEHKALWALKHANFDLKTAGDHMKIQINELNELRDQAYENSLIYKVKTKRLHDSKIKNRVFNIGDKVLLFNSRLKIFSGKLKSRWSGPFTILSLWHHRVVTTRRA